MSSSPRALRTWLTAPPATNQPACFHFFPDRLRGSKDARKIFLHSAVVGYHLEVPLSGSKEHTRVASVRAAMEELVKLFRKLKSRFYWFDFTVRG